MNHENKNKLRPEGSIQIQCWMVVYTDVMQIHVMKERAVYIHVCLCSCMVTQRYLEISGWYICRYDCIYTPTHTYSHTLAFLSVYIHVNHLYLYCAQSDFHLCAFTHSHSHRTFVHNNTNLQEMFWALGVTQGHVPCRVEWMEPATQTVKCINTG